MKIFFLHPHKTGGTSVIRKLKINRTHRTFKSLNFMNKDILNSKNSFNDIILNLKLLNQPKPKYLISNDKLKKYYYIGIVRDPYKRICSWYNNVSNDKNHQKKFYYKNGMSLFDFIKNNEKTLPLKPMTYWFTNWKEEYIIDNYIRNEYLEKDLNTILSKFKLQNVNLEYLNKSKTVYDYRNIIDEESVNWISINHSEDFVNFGYTKNINL